MLDRLVTLQMGQCNVVHRHIALKIYEGLVARLSHRNGSNADKPKLSVVFVRCRGTDRRQRFAAGGRSLPRRFPTALNSIQQVLRAHHAASAEVPFVEASRNEAADLCAVHRLDAPMRSQMHGGRPTGGHGDQIDRAAHTSAHNATLVNVKRSQRTTANPMSSLHVGNGSGHLHLYTGGARAGQQLRVSRFSQVGEQHLGTRPCQGDGVQICSVVVSHENSLSPRHHPVSIDIGSDRTRQHHTGSVVTRKHQRPLDCATGHDDACGTNDMQALPWHACSCICFTRRGTFDDAHRTSVVQAEGRRTGQDAHLASGVNIRQHLRQPAVLGAANRMAQQ